MMLAHHCLNNCLTWQEGEIGCLVIENPGLFAKIVEDVTEQAEGLEGNLIFSDNENRFDLSKEGFVVRDIVGIELNHRKIINAITGVLRENAQTDFIAETQQVQMAMDTLFTKLMQTVQYPIVFDAQCDISALLKAGNVHLLKEELLAERVLSLSLAAQEFLHTKLFIFVGLKAYLDKKELLTLYKDWAYKKLWVLLLEPHQREILPQERTLIVDEGLCELLFDNV